MGSTAPEEMPDSGDTLGGYRLVDIIADGGMGRVYEAEHLELERRVALKLLHPQQAAAPGAAERFFGEARAVSKLQHENLVAITDFVQDQGEHQYYIMELLSGGNLDAALEAGGAFSAARALPILIQLSDLFSALHDIGIVHRDLKPSNLFLITHAGQNDFVKLADFGIATTDDSAASNTGGIVGTPEYMSPEQASGNAVDYLTDVYAFGAVAYHLCAGRPPFLAADYSDMVIKHRTIAPTPFADLEGMEGTMPAALEEVIFQCLAKKQEDRPQSMQEVLLRLQLIGAELDASTLDKISGTIGKTMAPVAGKIRTVTADMPPAVQRQIAAFHGLSVIQRRGAVGVLAVAALAVVGALTTLGGAESPNTELGKASDAAVQSSPKAAAQAASPAKPSAAMPGTIALQFASTPTGAKVYRKGSTAALGVTPFAMRFESSSDLRTFLFKLDGWQSEAREVSMLQDTELAVPLVKRVVKASPASKKSNRGKKGKRRRKPRGG